MPAILLTRPETASRGFAGAIADRLGKVEVVISPLLRIEWLRPGLPGGVPIFTSPRGVEGFMRAGGKAGGPCWCVGEATGKAAAKAGFAPKWAGGDARSLIAAVLESGDRGPFAHFRGAHAVTDLARALRQAGHETGEAIVYDQPAVPLSGEARALLQGEKPLIVPLFSPRTARQFAGELPARAPLFVAAMSAAVRDALGDAGAEALEVAARPDAGAMLDAVERLFDAALRLERDRGGK